MNEKISNFTKVLTAKGGYHLIKNSGRLFQIGRRAAMKGLKKRFPALLKNVRGVGRVGAGSTGGMGGFQLGDFTEAAIGTGLALGILVAVERGFDHLGRYSLNAKSDFNHIMKKVKRSDRRHDLVDVIFDIAYASDVDLYFSDEGFPQDAGELERLISKERDNSGSVNGVADVSELADFFSRPVFSDKYDIVQQLAFDDSLGVSCGEDMSLGKQVLRALLTNYKSNPNRGMLVNRVLYHVGKIKCEAKNKGCSLSSYDVLICDADEELASKIGDENFEWLVQRRKKFREKVFTDNGTVAGKDVFRNFGAGYQFSLKRICDDLDYGLITGNDGGREVEGDVFSHVEYLKHVFPNVKIYDGEKLEACRCEAKNKRKMFNEFLDSREDLKEISAKERVALRTAFMTNYKGVYDMVLSQDRTLDKRDLNAFVYHPKTGGMVEMAFAPVVSYLVKQDLRKEERMRIRNSMSFEQSRLDDVLGYVLEHSDNFVAMRRRKREFYAIGLVRAVLHKQIVDSLGGEYQYF